MLNITKEIIMSIYVQVKLEDLIKLVSEKTESKQSIQEQENLKK